MQVDNEPHFKSNHNSVKISFGGIYLFAHPKTESIRKHSIKTGSSRPVFHPSFDFKVKQLRQNKWVQGVRDNGKTWTKKSVFCYEAPGLFRGSF